MNTFKKIVNNNSATSRNALTNSADRIAQDHNNTPFVQENTIMNTFKKIANRATVLLAFGGLLALSQPAAKADVLILGALGSAQTPSAPGTTSMQFLVQNFDNYTVSGVKISSTVFAFPGDAAYPVSSPFSLAPYQVKWITVALPASGINHMPLLNKMLTVFASTSPKSSFSFSFQNVLPQAMMTLGDIQKKTDTNTGAITYTFTFTNNGAAASKPEKVIVTTNLGYSGEQQGQSVIQTNTLPALQPGQHATLTFTSQAPGSLPIFGSIQAGDIYREF